MPEPIPGPDVGVELPERALSPEASARMHRRRTDDANYLRLHQRVTDCENSIGELKVGQAAINGKLDSISENTGKMTTILEAWDNAQGFWKTLNFLASSIKVVVTVFAFIGAMWIFWKTGNWLKLIE